MSFERVFVLVGVNMNPKKIEKWIVYYTNKERKKRKRKTLKSEKHLTKAARKYAKYMLKKNKLGHHIGYKTPWQRAMKYVIQHLMLERTVCFIIT